LLLISALFAAVVWLAIVGAPIRPAGAFQIPGMTGYAAAVAMGASYMPVLHFYGLHPLRALTLPCVATGFLVMTWHSAFRYWAGTATVWKDRRYPKTII
jgi:hypothetical protein